MERISKYSPAMRMRDLIDDNSMLLMALSRFAISLGFGEKSVEEVCNNQKVDCRTFLAVANFISFGIVNDDILDLQSLVKYLENAHSYFLDFCLPRIRRRLIEAIDCSGNDEVAMLILSFYDSYFDEVKRHMDHENDHVFRYVKSLLDGRPDPQYHIGMFASSHHGINDKLQELKDIIIRYLPQRDNNLLNVVLFDIINCEQDLMMHCCVEDSLFVPAVEALETDVNEAARDEEPQNDHLSTRRDVLGLREKEIVAAIARGLSSKEIADELCLSVHTVTTHRRNIAQKLQIHSSAGLTIYAVINGLVKLDELKIK